MTNPTFAAMGYDPQATERLPWTIVVGHRTIARLNDYSHGATALTLAHDMQRDEGLSTEDAVYQALNAAQGLEAEEWEPVDDPGRYADDSNQD